MGAEIQNSIKMKNFGSEMCQIKFIWGAKFRGHIGSRRIRSNAFKFLIHLGGKFRGHKPRRRIRRNSFIFPIQLTSPTGSIWHLGIPDPPQSEDPHSRRAKRAGKNHPLSAQTLIKPCVFLPNRRAKRADFFENQTSLNQIGGVAGGKNHPNSKIH